MTCLAGMRIAFAAFEPFPNRKGSGTRIARAVRALAAAGAEVELLTLAGALPETDLGPRIRHRRARLREHNYLARALAWRRFVSTALLDLRPDRAHVRGPFEGRAAADEGLPLVFEVNGLPSVELRYHHPQVARDRAFLGRLVELERSVLRAADAWVTQSRTTARFLARLAPPPRPAWVVPNGVDPARFRPSSHDAETVRLVYVGSLAPWQGLDLLLSALRDLKHDPRWTLEVIGGGRKAWQASLRTTLRELGLGRRVELSGPLDRHEVATRLGRADVALCPLRRDLRNRVQGCSPIKLFEYGAAGAAVLASDLPCLREIYGPAEAVWVPPRASRYRTSLARLLADPAWRRVLGAHARRAVLERHQWWRRDAALVAGYAELAAGTGARRSAPGSPPERARRQPPEAAASARASA